MKTERKMRCFTFNGDDGSTKTLLLDHTLELPGDGLSGKCKLKLRWTCSDFVHHEHRTRLGAMLCGWVQWFFSKKGGSQ